MFHAERWVFNVESFEYIWSMVEEWRPIVGWEKTYDVSNLGNVRSIGNYTWRITRKQLLDQYGYPCINLCSKGKKKRMYIHRLVALTFIPNPEGKKQVNHKDGNKLNNGADNLEWVTNAENQLHAYRELGKKGNQVRFSGTVIVNGVEYGSIHKAAKATNTNYNTIVRRCFNSKNKDYQFIPKTV